MNLLSRIVLIAAVLLETGIATARILRVPEEYITITLAFNSSQDSDTIVVSPGSYHERIVFPAGVRTLASRFILSRDSSDVLSTVLEPDSSADPDSLSILSVFDRSSVAHVIGLSLQHGQGTTFSSLSVPFGGAIFILAGKLNARSCIFTENEAAMGSAIYADTGRTSLHIENCDFGYNTVYQGTVAARGDSMIAILSRFHHNSAQRAAAGYARLGYARFDSCLIDSNQNDDVSMGAIAITGCDTAIICHCTFRANSADTINSFPGGLALDLYDTPARVDCCLFEDNISISTPGMIVAEGDVNVSRCVFRRNRTARVGGIVSLVQNCTVNFNETLFEDNTAFRYPAISAVDEVHLENCRFVGNRADRPDTAGALEGAVYTIITVITAQNCAFENNWPYAVYNCYRPTPDFDVSNCWWGDPSGPYHAMRNPQGLGDAICGDSVLFEPWLTEPPAKVGERPIPLLPTDHTLITVFPNPFNSAATIRLSVPRSGLYELNLYDILGRRLQPVWSGPIEHDREILLNAQSFSSGTYFLSVVSSEQRYPSATAKIILLR